MGISHLSFKSRQIERRASTHCHLSHGSRSASLLRRAPMLLRVSQLWIPSPYSGGLRCCHVSHGSGSRLPAREGFGAATCHTVSDPASLLGRASVLPRVPRVQTPSLCLGGLRCCHVPPASLFRRAPMLPHVPRLRTLLSCSRGGPDALTCSTTLKGLWVLRIKKVLAVTACSKARVFSRHIRVLSRCL
jgi:hypothetical protein